MADGLLPLNPATIPGGQSEDIETLVGAGGAAAFRQRLQVTGALLIEIARVMSLSPTGSEFGLVTRNIPATPLTSSLVGVEINAAAAGDNVIVPGVAAQTVRVFKFFLVASGSVSLKFKDGAGVDLTPYMAMSAGGSITLDFDTQPWFVTAAANGFIINLSAPVQVSGRLMFQQS